MHRHWNDTILPIIKKIKPTHIVEVGSDTGINTKNILEYCANNNSKLSAIDPNPNFDVVKFKEEYGDKFEFFDDLSLNILPFLKKFEVILLDGDHNWYTIYNELKTIENIYKKNGIYPIIFLHDTSWPYARRDLYYNPDTIPEEYLLPYKNLGIIPDEKKVQTTKGMNSNLNNAIFEGGNKNGVLTAIEDYINESSLDLSFYTIPTYHGLGILFLKDNNIEKIIESTINYKEMLENLENYYLTQILSNINDEKNQLIYNLNKEKTTLQKNNTEKDNTIQQLTNEKTTLQKNNTEKDNTIQQLTNEKTTLQKINDNHKKEILNLKHEHDLLMERTIVLTKTKEELYENTNEKINNLTEKNNHLESLIEMNNTKISELTSKQQEQIDEIKRLNKLINSQKNKINEYEKSNSWKITEPFRKLANKLRKIKNKSSNQKAIE